MFGLERGEFAFYCAMLLAHLILHNPSLLLIVFIRTDKVQSFEDKVAKVQQILGK
jgi:hypothetical protein